MAIGQGGAAVISSGIQLAGEYIFGKGARNAQKDALKAQRRLLDLQAQEQVLKNQALSMSLSDKNQLLPFATSLPGKMSVAGTGAFPDTAPVQTTATTTAGYSGGALLLLALIALGALFATKAVL